MLSSWLLGVPKSDDPVIFGLIALCFGSGFARSMGNITTELRDLPAILDRDFIPVKEHSLDWSVALFFLNLGEMLWHCFFGVPKGSTLYWLGGVTVWLFLVTYRTIDEIVQQLKTIKAILRKNAGWH
jgi:hypothetical protein